MTLLSSLSVILLESDLLRKALLRVMNIFHSKKIFFLFYNCIFLLSFLTYGSFAEGSELVVTGTATDTGGILDNLVEVTIVGTTTKQVYCNEFGEWTATFEVENGPHSVTASGYDNCGNSFTTPEKVVYAGEITLNITDPASGSVSGTGGFPYVSCNVTGTKDVGGQSFVIAELPFQATFIDYSASGPSTFFVTVDSKDGDGAIRQADNQFTITSSAPTGGRILGTVTGYIEVSLPANAGSDGLSQDVVIVATINNVAEIGPNTDTSTITVQLAHFGVDPIKNVYDTEGTFNIQICVFVDPADATPPAAGLAGYDFELAWTSTVFTYSSGGGGTCGFDSPTITPGAGTLRINDDSIGFPPGEFCAGWMKISYLIFNRVGEAGSSSILEIRLTDDDPLSFVDNSGDPLPSDRDQDGVVRIIPTPVPVVDQVCDSLAPAECNPASIPIGGFYNIDIHGSNFDCADYTVNITAGTGDCNLIADDVVSCTGATLIVHEVFVFNSGGCCNVSVTNNATGMTSNVCDDCLCAE